MAPADNLEPHVLSLCCRSHLCTAALNTVLPSTCTWCLFCMASIAICSLGLLFMPWLLHLVCKACLLNTTPQHAALLQAMTEPVPHVCSHLIYDTYSGSDTKIDLTWLTASLGRATCSQPSISCVRPNDLLQAFIANTICPAASVAEQHAAGQPPQPSVIVCPSTLVAHWVHEISKFVGPDLLQPLQYQGNPGERAALQPLINSHNVLVLGYEVSCQQGVPCAG